MHLKGSPAKALASRPAASHCSFPSSLSNPFKRSAPSSTGFVSNTYFLFRYIIRQPSIRILLYCQQAGLMSFVNAGGE